MNENQAQAKILEFQKFKNKKEQQKRSNQFVELDVADLLAESEAMLKALELNPLNAEIGLKSQQLIKEILFRLGDLEEVSNFHESHSEADEKLKAITPYL